MNMTFGDWELFKALILSLREKQMLNLDDENKSSKKCGQNQYHQPNTPPERKGT